MKPALLYYDVLAYQPWTLQQLADCCEVIRLPDPDADDPDVLRRVSIATAPLGFQFGRAKIDQMPCLRGIVSSTLVVPHIDVDYAVARGIAVRWLQDARMLADITATAELAWGLVIAVTRHLVEAHGAGIEGRWGGRPFGRRTPRMLSRMTLGIVGLGRLGRMVARYGRAFGMQVCYVSPHSRDPQYDRCDSLAELARRADIVSVHAAHTEATSGLIDDAFFNEMKDGSFLVNTSRGALVDEGALLQALEQGRLAGAALDALAAEYAPGFRERLADHPVVHYARTHTNLILTPHYGGATVDAWERIERAAVDLIREAAGSHAPC